MALATARERWRAFCQEELSGGGRRFYCWLRGPLNEAPASAAGATASQGVLAGLSLARAVAGWGVSKVSGLPPFPSMPPVTASGLQALAASVPSAKAPGAEGWTCRHIAGWPPPLLDALSRFYTLVEPAGRWPAWLAGPFGRSAAQGGTPDPMDKRPIVLLPVVYRLWAALRGVLRRTPLPGCWGSRSLQSMRRASPWPGWPSSAMLWTVREVHGPCRALCCIVMVRGGGSAPTCWPERPRRPCGASHRGARRRPIGCPWSPTGERRPRTTSTTSWLSAVVTAACRRSPRRGGCPSISLRHSASGCRRASAFGGRSRVAGVAETQLRCRARCRRCHRLQRAHVRDLGVDQQVGAPREGAIAAARVAGAAGRLLRCRAC